MSRPTTPEIALRHIRHLCAADAAKHEPGMTYSVLRSSVLELACDGLEGVYEQPPAGLTPVQARADELLDQLRWTMRFIGIYAHEHMGPATPELNKVRALLDELEPPKPPTIDEAIAVLRTVQKSRPDRLPDVIANYVDAFLKRVQN